MMFEENEALVEQGKWDEAEASLLLFVADHPVHPKGHALLGMCLGRKGDIDAASVHFQRAWALDPMDWGSGKNLLKCYEYMGRHKDGLEVAHGVLKNHPGDADVTGAVDRITAAMKAQEPADDREKVWGR